MKRRTFLFGALASLPVMRLLPLPAIKHSEFLVSAEGFSPPVVFRTFANRPGRLEACWDGIPLEVVESHESGYSTYRGIARDQIAVIRAASFTPDAVCLDWVGFFAPTRETEPIVADLLKGRGSIHQDHYGTWKIDDLSALHNGD